jgi:hypothetical protein
VVHPRHVLRSQVLGHGKCTSQTQLNLVVFDLYIYHILVLTLGIRRPSEPLEDRQEGLCKWAVISPRHSVVWGVRRSPSEEPTACIYRLQGYKCLHQPPE